MNTELSKIEQNPVAVFTGGGLDAILKKIEADALAHVPELETAKGRKAIASVAYKVAQSKTFIDDHGKALVSDWKAKAKTVDATRRHAREFLDEVRDKVRQPLTDWENEQKAREEAERVRQEVEAAHGEALAMNDLFDRQKEIERKEAELAAQEAAKHEAEEKERIRREAEKKARKEAQERIELERERAERAERERIAAEERAKAEKERAVREAQERAKREAEQKERARLEQEAAEKREAERKAANKAHQKKINNEALSCLVAGGFTEKDGKKIIRLIAECKIKNISINY